ncbi:MAG: nickel-dependent hydrogenase large subunit [Rhodocyclaceae bacterium]|nr:nickel-dependent hydrogenase large subunit [Rhodocyclaceae bacterium]
MKPELFDAGAVHLGLRWDAGRSADVRLRIARPTAAAAMLGRPADQAVRLVPLLHSLCGAAQGAAARLALQAARGEASTPAIDGAVLAEAQREHLWRLLLDWPAALGLPPQQALLVEGRRRLQDGSFAAWMGAALKVPFAAVEAAANGLSSQPLPDGLQSLPALTAAETATLWPRLDGNFSAAPTYRGRPAETGALARHGAGTAISPLLARIRARMDDLHAAHGLGRTSAATIAAGVGRAAVETARGLLLHEITLDGDRISAYVIVAPTEWNFHPEGVLKTWLQDALAATPDELKAQAARAVLALDPCVRCTIEVDSGEAYGSDNIN